MVQEDEVLTIIVKPGWRIGTTITFPGMGNEIPGGQAADMKFIIAEKQHPVFKKEGDDLVLKMEISLVDSLAGCTLSIPLLDGQKLSLIMEDLIYPGSQKVIAGQGMPKSKEQGERGNLIVNFGVEFPKELTDEQRSDLFSILQDSC